METLDILVARLNQWGPGFWTFARSMFFQVGILIIALSLIDLLLRSHRRISACLRYGLWLLVLVKLLCPPTLALPTGIGYWLHQESPQVTPKVAPSIQISSEKRYLPPVVMHFDLPRDDPQTLTHAIAIPHKPKITLKWQGWVLLLWLEVVSYLGIVLLYRYLMLRRWIRHAQDTSDDVMKSLQACCHTLGIRSKISLRLCDSLPGPVVCGFGRPVILLPTSLPDQLSPESLQMVLGHELIHVQRRDTWVSLLQSLLQIIYFYHPLVWLANWRTGRLREQAVDETVLNRFKLKVNQYSETLIRIAQMAYTKPTLTQCFVGLAESRDILEGRIEHMLRQKTSHRARLGWTGLLIVIALGALLVPMGQGETIVRTQTVSETDDVPALPEGIVDLFDLNKDEVLEIFGTPRMIFYGDERYSLFNLPERYFLVFGELSFSINNDEVQGITLLDEKYVFGNGCHVGNTEEEVIALFGSSYIRKESSIKDIIEYQPLGISFEVYHDSQKALEINIEPDYGDPSRIAAYQGSQDFLTLFPERIVQLDIDHANLDEVKRIFGEPVKYVWGSETFSPDDLPERYIAVYPGDFGVCIENDSIWEVRLEHTEFDYDYLGAIRINMSLDDVMEVLGPAQETVIGQKIGFADKVLYQDIEGRRGHCYYQSPEHHVRMFFANNRLTALYITRTQEREDELLAQKHNSEFGQLMPKRMAALDIDQASREDVENLFGSPLKYIWGKQTFTADTLPDCYIIGYPCGLDLWMLNGQINEVRHDELSPYISDEGIYIGATLDEVIAILGDPIETVVGQENSFKDGVLYRNIEGSKGYDYYHRSDHHVRVWFSDDKVMAFYLTRSDFPTH